MIDEGAIQKKLDALSETYGYNRVSQPDELYRVYCVGILDAIDMLREWLLEPHSAELPTNE